jgi:hypothetical protein
MSREAKAEYDGEELPALMDEDIQSVCSYSDAVFTTRRVYSEPYVVSDNVLTMYKAHDFKKVRSYSSNNKTIQRVIAYSYYHPTGMKVVIAVLYEGLGPWGELVPSTIEFHTSKIGLNAMTDDMTWEDCFDVKEIQCGYSANDMVLLNPNGIPYLFVVSNGDSRIYIVDGIEQKVDGFGLGIDDNYLEIPCDPYSIREVSFKIISATVSSYDGYLYYIDNIFNYSADFSDADDVWEYPTNLKIKSDAMSDASYLFNSLGESLGENGVMLARTLTMDMYYQPEDEVEIFYVGYTGILENNNSLKVFPNPVESVVNIELEEMLDINFIRLIDNEGKYIQTLTNYSANENIIQINIPKLQVGNYFIELNTPQGNYIQKIIVK